MLDVGEGWAEGRLIEKPSGGLDGDVDPPGFGLTTVTAIVVPMELAVSPVTVAWSWVEDTMVVVTDVPATCICAPETNPVPVTVSVPVVAP
jgi:hypothetical protein